MTSYGMHKNPQTHKHIRSIGKLKLLVGDYQQHHSNYYGNILRPSYRSIIGIDRTDDEEYKIDEQKIVREFEVHSSKQLK